MNCTLTLALISETQEGNIGEDWKYHLSVKAFEDDLDGDELPTNPTAAYQTVVPYNPTWNYPPVVVGPSAYRERARFGRHGRVYCRRHPRS